MSLKEFLSSRPFQRILDAAENIALELKRLRHAVDLSNKIAAFRLYEQYYEGQPESDDPISKAVNGILEETVDEFRSVHGSGDERPEAGG
jgi:hypothetical protein